MINISICIVATEQHLMEKAQWSFNDDFARDVIILGVDNSSSAHTDNLKIIF